MIEIQLHSPVPIYEQLVEELGKKIRAGDLKPGSKLPTIRALASQLDVAINTVARAYNELEREHLIVSNGRKGSYVREAQTEPADAGERIFKPMIIALLQKGMDREEIERVFQANLNQIFH